MEDPFAKIRAKGTFINDAQRFLAIFEQPTYLVRSPLVLLYNVPFWGSFLDPPPTYLP